MENNVIEKPDDVKSEHSIDKPKETSSQKMFELKKADNITKLLSALTKFQHEIKNPINTKESTMFSYKYTPLEDVLNTIRPVLSKHGLSFVQIPITHNAMVGVKTLLFHESGEMLETPVFYVRSDKITAHGVGSALTYARRYSLSTILGVAGEDDDDANMAAISETTDYATLMEVAQNLCKKHMDNNQAQLANKIIKANIGQRKISDLTPSDRPLLYKTIKQLEKGL